MNQRSKLRLGVLGAALATTAVFAGTYATLDDPTLKTTADNNTMVTTGHERAVVEPQATSEPSPIAVPVVDQSTPAAQPAPIAVAPPPAVATEPAMTITEQRLTVDERIQVEVMDALRRNESLTGKVGVETQDRVVRLSGWLGTSGQVMRAGRTAGQVMDVRYVVNEIRPRVGPVTN